MKGKISEHPILRWAPAVLIMIAIFIASSTPSSQIPRFGVIDILIKKGGHFLEYAALAVAFLFGFGNLRPRTIFLAVLLAFFYACSDELHQVFTAGRHPSPVDVGIDTLGAACGALVRSRIKIKRLS